MPKVKRNAMFLEALQDMRDEHESDSNRYTILNKAFNSLRKETKEYISVDSLAEVKFIGPKIISDLKKRFKDAGGPDTMGKIPSNIPSPNKRKRANGATSASEPGKRGRPPKQPLFSPGSDDEEILPLAKRHAPPNLARKNHRDFQADVPLGFSAPQYPLEVHPPTHNAHIANSQPTYHPLAPNSLYGSQNYSPHVYQQALGHVPSNVAPSVPPPQPAHSVRPFHFSYLDESGRQVLTCDKAIIDIEAGAMWYKFGFIDGPESKAHPLRQRIRMDSYDNRKGKRRDEIIQAWIRDEDVEAFGLHRAPGIMAVPMDVDRHPATSGIGSQTTTHSQDRVVGRTAVKAKTSETSKVSGSDSLQDLLKAENKKKRNTIDPSRVMDTGKQWSVRNGGVAPADGVIKKEEARSQQPDVPLQDSMRQRMASAALARQQSSSIIAEASLSSSRSQQSSTSMANASLRRTNTLPEISRDSDITQRVSYAPPMDFGLPVPFDASGSATTSVRHATQQAPEGLRRTVTAPANLPPPAPAALPLSKSKPKGRVRGRVSEFAPNLRAVDEFDNDLDRQASQRAQTERAASTSALSASADLIDDVTDLTMVNAPSFAQFNPIIFPRGSFDIILVLDNREIKSQDNRSHIVNELRKRGVNVVQRSLALGDVLWIAKRRNPVAAEDENECVLDYILERKRLDDLCLSIKDGRFREQKFRLTNTGLKVFYLIEEYDLDKNREIFGVQIDTARSSTQIVDDFIVKETKKLSYTIDFLVTMHRTIESKYRDESLYMIPSNIVRRHSYMALQKHLRNSQPTIRYLTSYPTFENLNNKSKNLTMKDLFTQMLLCVKGVSPEKASAIVATYPTLRDLWEAFRIAELDEKEGNKLAEEEAALAAEQGKKVKGKTKKQKVPQAKEMLCDLEASGRQRIGPVLSANIYRLVRANSYKE